MATEPGALVSSPQLRFRRLLLVFVLTLGASGVANLVRKPLGFVFDEWMWVGMHLRVHGNVGWQGTPGVFRPPGYPAFVAASLAFVPDPETELVTAVACVLVAQSLLLAATAALLYWWLSSSVSTTVAFVAAILFGTNPFSLVLFGMLSYGGLHVFMLVGGGYVLHRAFASGSRRALFLAGVVWGVATLVRPVTLILPPFFLLLAYARARSVRRAVAITAVFVLGFGLTIAPWTLRNYGLTGRFVPVNAQFWTVFWRTTAAPLDPSPDHSSWLGELHGHLPILYRATGKHFNLDTFTREILAIEDAHKVEVLNNLNTKPSVYLLNCLQSFAVFNLRMNTILVQSYQAMQTPGGMYREKWFRPGHPQTFHSRTVRDGLAVFFALLTALALVDLVVWYRTRDTFPGVPAALYLCLCLGHSLVYMDMPYYYVKLPFLFLFPFHALGRLPDRTFTFLGRPIPLQAAILAFLGLFSAALTAGMLFS